MRTHLQVEHELAAATLGAGPVDGGHSGAVGERSGHERVVADRGADDQEHALCDQFGIGLLDRERGARGQAESGGVHELNVAVEAPVREQFVDRKAQVCLGTAPFGGFVGGRVGHVIEDSHADRCRHRSSPVPVQRRLVMTSSPKRLRLSIFSWRVSGSVSRPYGVEAAEPTRSVGDTEILEPLDAVEGERLRRRRVDGERLALASGLPAQVVHAVDHRDQVVEHAAGTHPAVGETRRAPEVGVAVPADQHRHRLRRHRLHLDRREVVELAVVLEVPAGGETAHDLDALVEPPAPALPRQLDDLVVVGPRARADAEHEAVVAEDRE